MTISYSDLKKGTVIELDNEPWQVVDWQHNRMQQRAPVLTLKLRNLKTGRSMQRNMPGNHRLTLAEVDSRQSQYIYNDSDHFYFMDLTNFEQYPLDASQVGTAIQFIKEQDQVELILYNGSPISIELPTFVELVVTDTPPPIKGNTAQGSTKPADLETGLKVNVPFFINPGDSIRVDTRTGEYLERVG